MNKAAPSRPPHAPAFVFALCALFSAATPAWPAAGPVPDAGVQAGRWPPQPAAAPRQLLISVRYGGPGESAGSRSVTAGSRDAAGDEQRIRGQDGQWTLIASSQSSSAATQRYARTAGTAAESGSMIEVLPTLSGNTVLVRMLARRQTASPSGSGSGQGQQLDTSLSMSLGEWTEVSGSGPWAASATHETASSRDARNDARRVFLRIDEIRR